MSVSAELVTNVPLTNGMRGACMWWRILRRRGRRVVVDVLLVWCLLVLSVVFRHQRKNVVQGLISNL